MSTKTKRKASSGSSSAATGHGENGTGSKPAAPASRPLPAPPPEGPGTSPTPSSDYTVSEAGSAAAPPSRLRAVLTEMFGIDIRSLVFFRVSLALMLLADLFTRFWDLEAFYTDFGVLPRDRLNIAWDNHWYLCLHSFTGSATGQGVFFAFAAIFAVMLLVGWRTRFATFASWVLLISINSRNPIVLQGGDVLLRTLVFWAMFLPLGAYASLDARKAAARAPDNVLRPAGGNAVVLSFATAAALLQVAYVYWFTVALKTDSSWHTDGLAVWMALNLDAFASPVGVWMRSALPIWMLRLMTYGTVALEVSAPSLALMPLGARRLGPQVRTAVVIGMWLFHFFLLGVPLRLGPFPYICSLGWALFLPPWFWDTLTPRLWSCVPPPARRAVEGIWTRFTHPAPAPTPARRPSRPIATSLRLHPFWQVITAVLLVYISLWNLRGLDGKRFPFLPHSVDFVGEWTHLDQFWAMFAPRPMTDDGWFVFAGTLRDGETVDLYKVIRNRRERDGLGPIDYSKPALAADTYRDERWRKYLINLWDRNNVVKRLWLAAYLRRWWDRSHPDPARQLVALDLVFMEEDTPKRPGMPIQPPRMVHLWRSQWDQPVVTPAAAATANNVVNDTASGAVRNTSNTETTNATVGGTTAPD